jgi:hypothetical protein
MPDQTIEIPNTNTLAIGTTEGLLDVRGQTHGNYSNTSKYTQQLKTVAYGAYFERRQRNQPALTNQQKESLEMILLKCGRILSGDPSFADHWDDIAGYAKLANKEF